MFAVLSGAGVVFWMDRATVFDRLFVGLYIRHPVALLGIGLAPALLRPVEILTPTVRALEAVRKGRVEDVAAVQVREETRRV